MSNEQTGRTRPGGETETGVADQRVASGDVTPGGVPSGDVPSGDVPSGGASGDPRFERIVRNASTALFLLDERARCAFMNRAAEELTGYAADDVVARGLHLRDFVHLRQLDGAAYPISRCLVDHARLTRARVVGEDLFVHRDGHRYAVIVTATPVLEGRRAVATVIEARDASADSLAARQERAELMQRSREAESRAEFIARAGVALSETLDVPDALDRIARIVVPEIADWMFVMLARAHEPELAIALHRDPSKSPIVTALLASYPRLDASHGYGRALATGEPELIRSPETELLGEGAHDDEHRALLHVLGAGSALHVPLRMGEGVLGSMSFVTGPHRPPFEPRDLALAQELATRVAIALERARLYGEAQRERARAEAASRARNALVATVSHELRTPMNAVLGWARLLRSGALTRETLDRALAAIERNTDAQIQLIEDLLDHSRIAAGHLRLELSRADVGEVVRGAVESVTPLSESKGIELRCTVDAGAGGVSADPRRLHQVICNLITNAVKFTPAGGRIEVTARRCDGRVEVAVADTGRGIDPAFLPHIFDRFAQEHETATAHEGGVGLGLPIAKQLVELHGGNLRVESEGLGHGATFRVELPAGAPA